MAVKNKDVLILIKKIEKYLKEECYISFEHIDLKHYTINYSRNNKSEKRKRKEIIISTENKKRNCCFCIEENSKKIKSYVFFYNKGLSYHFEDLEKEVINSDVLNAYNILLKSKIIKIENF